MRKKDKYIRLTDDDFIKGNKLLSKFVLGQNMSYFIAFNENWNAMWNLFRHIKNKIGHYPEVDLHGWTNLSWWYSTRKYHFSKNKPRLNPFELIHGKFFNFKVYYAENKKELKFKPEKDTHIILCSDKCGPELTAWYACVLWVKWYNKTVLKLKE